MSMDYSAIEKAINDTKADIKKYLEKDEYKMMAAFEAQRIIGAVNQNAKGYVIFKTIDGGVQSEANCNEALMIIIMMSMLEEFGIEKFIKLEAARRITNAFIEKREKRFDTPEEMEVFKKMHNMSAEDIEKIKNEK